MTDISAIKLNRFARIHCGLSKLVLRLVFALTGLALALTGCGGGSGSGNQSADPVVVENAVAFIKRPLLLDQNGDLVAIDFRTPERFRPGAQLFLKDRASASAVARDISSSAFSDPSFLNDEGQLLYDVRDLSVSYDGTKLLFAMRAPEIEDADEEDQPKWNIWEYDTTTSNLRRIITSDVLAEAGHDIAPAYLPDGGIVFSSTRQRTSKAVLLDEGKPQFDALEEGRNSPAFVLHVMKSDGSDIQQITFNQSHDLDPTVLDDGKIVFSRWDRAGQTQNNGVNLYQVNPDGTGLAYLYGRHSHDSEGEGGSVQYFRAVETAARRLLVQVSPFESANLSVLTAEIDVGTFVEADRTLDGGTGQGQVPLVTGLDAFGVMGLNGLYGMASPLFDGTNRYLVSWSPCRLVRVDGEGGITNCTEERLASAEYEAAAPVYGLWIRDVTSATQLPIERPVEGHQFEAAVLMTSRPLPTFLPASTPSDEARGLGEAGYGILHIRSVYDFDGVDTAPGGIAAQADPVRTAPDNRPLRFVRIEKPVSIPSDEVRDFNNTAFGRSQAQSMREILGYAPVEPDGSVRLAVPANVAFAISVLDAQGQRVTQRHQNWLQVRPGETIECLGCHTQDSEVPHGRYGAGPESINSGAATTGLEFPNTETALVADMGETMAQTITRINGIRKLTPDIRYDDEWTNPAVTPKANSRNYVYADLSTTPPVTPACAADWTSICRILINYEQHIHPLWAVDRRVLDVDGVTVLDDRTCTSCHADADAMGVARVPDAQLDLTNGISPDQADHFKSYRELLFNDNEQELLNGALIDRLVDTGQLQRNEDGELILDADGNPIPVFATVPVSAVMNTAGALASPRFMDRFRAGGAHAGFLSDAELKLIAEWLDLGAQYYNNPFDAPAD